MEAEETTLDLREYLSILRRRRLVIIGAFLVVVAASGLISWRMTPIYQAAARLEVQPVSASSAESSKILESLVDPTRALQTQVELIKSKSVLEGAANDLGLPGRDEIEKSMEVELVRDTQIVEIRIDHERPEEARDWANAVAEAYIAFRRDRAVDQSLTVGEALGKRAEETRSQIAGLDQQLSNPSTASTAVKAQRDSLVGRLAALETQLQGLPDAEAVRRGGGTIVAPAETPDTPDRPNIKLNVALAAIVGAMLGIGLAFLAENLDDRIRNPEELERRVGAPTLGYVPLMEDWAKNGGNLVTVHEPASGAAESFRTLRTNLRFVSMEKPLNTLLVTSALAEEGKTTIAANLAVAFAQGGTRTVLMAADLRRPTVHKLFGISNSIGLLNLLDPEFPLEEAFQSTEVPNLRVLSAGGLPPNPTEILASARVARVLKTLNRVAELVIIDAPPVLGLGDASALASRADGTLLVMDPDKSVRRQLDHAVDQLKKAGGKIVGSVVNAVEPEEGYGYYYQYYYSQYSADDDGAQEKVGVRQSRSART